ncbi:MAG: glutathione-disulfide reductase [Armatimonadetes bacterium]|nr:glutathione-disulfide reductase [Armatimonadota bacterium]
MKEFDLLVVGGGSGGVAAARRAAEYGARVGICEEDRYGGTCVHRGCVPKKLLVYAAEYADFFEDSQGYGWTPGSPEFDWKRLIQAKDRELDRLNDFYNRLLVDAGIERIRGKARWLDAHTVEVEGARYRGETLLIATGGWPFVPPVEGREHAITSNEAFQLAELPRRIVIAGSGYIGVEFACIFNRLGSRVTMAFGSERVLPDFDQDLRRALQAEMEARGIVFRTGARLRKLEKVSDGLIALLNDGTSIECDQLMSATGRVPNTRGIGLEEIGVELRENGAVVVGDDGRTAVGNVYAVGDCTDRIQLTPVAIAEGRALAETLYNNNPTRVSYRNVATAVFSIPQAAAVGLTEARAREELAEVDVYRSTFRPMRYSLPRRHSKTTMKLVVDRATDRVVGCHLVGEGAGELIQVLAVALECGATKKQFDRTVAVHPTVAEELVLMRWPV